MEHVDYDVNNARFIEYLSMVLRLRICEHGLRKMAGLKRIWKWKNSFHEVPTVLGVMGLLELTGLLIVTYVTAVSRKRVFTIAANAMNSPVKSLNHGPKQMKPILKPLKD